jgi:hypothetical protein
MAYFFQYQNVIYLSDCVPSRQEFECCGPKFWYLVGEDDIESSFICLKLDVVWTGRGLKQGMRLGDT